MRKRCIVLLLVWLSAAVAADAAVIKVKVAIASIRSQPDAAASVVSRATQGALFEVVKKLESWYEISVVDSAGNIVTGYISSDSVEEVGGMPAPAPAAAAPVAKVEAPPQPAPPPVSRPETPPAEPRARTGGGGMRFEFHLGGGLSMIDGEDYNSVPRGFNQYYADMNKFYAENQTGYTYTWASDRPEAKSMTNLKGEFILRFNRWVGIGIGFEFLTKPLTGHMERNYGADGYRVDYSTYYYLETATTKYTFDYDDSIRALPLTFSIYGFLPIGRSLEIFALSGAGFYLGWLNLKMTEVGTYDDVDYYYYKSTGAQYNTRKNQGEYNYEETSKLTSTAFGFHVGIGFGYFLGRNIELFGEALYRAVNFKEWTGDFSWNDSDVYYYGYQSSGYNNYTETDQDAYSGVLYSADYHSSTLNKDYPGQELAVYESEPTETASYTNFKKAAINLSGVVFRVGLRIGFGQR